jgi:hypothetical protein
LNFSEAATAHGASQGYIDDMGHVDHFAAPLFSALAQEIREIRGLMEGIADILVADESLVTAYLEQLQSFDLAIQRSDESAAVLDRMANGAHAIDAIKSVRLTYVQDRLAAALAASRKHYGPAAEQR